MKNPLSRSRERACPVLDTGVGVREKNALLTTNSTTLNIEHMNYYTDRRLDELGFSSEEEAEELEFELELRFEDFTPKDRKTWRQQTTYLEYFSRIGTTTSAAQEAGVTGYTAQRWKYDNVLGFTRRLEMATLIFKDRLKEKALRRASDPKAPATLLIELLRAYIPEEFSRNGHKCDTSKADELLRRFREDAHREKEAGHPKLRKMAEGAENAYPDDDLNTQPASPYDNPSLDSSEASQHDPTSPNRHTHERTSPRAPIRGENPQNPSALSAPSAVNPPAPAVEHSNSHLSPTGEDSLHSHLSPAGGEIQRGGSSRAQRREQLRQQRKAEKQNTFPVKRF